MISWIERQKKRGVAQACNALLMALILLVVSLAPTLGQAVVLTELTSAALPGDEVELQLGFDSTPPQVTGYTIEKPARIALDLHGSVSQLTSKYHNINTGDVRTVTVVETKDRTRMIINLSSLSAYSTRVEGNSIYVRIGNTQHGTPVVTPQARAAINTVKQPPSIVEIDFKRGSLGEGQVVVKLSNASIPVDVRQESGLIIAEFIGAKLPEKLRRRLDVTDFGTPITQLDVTTEGSNAVFIINPVGDYEYLAYQADNEFTINVKPLTPIEIKKKREDEFSFTGEKLSLNFQDIEVRSVLQLIADFTELNLVASDTVGGRITLRLQNVPWDQALDLILKTKGLDKRKIGNVMLIAPADEIASRERLELESQAQIEALAPIYSDFIEVNYAKASVLMGVIKSAKGLLSARGSVTIDDRTNTIIINDTKEKLGEIHDVITRLDTPIKQVLIEARIVSASSNFANQVGVKWGGLDLDVGTSTVKAFSGNLENVRDANVNAVNGDAIVINNPGDLMVDLGVSAEGASSFAVGFTSLGLSFLELELSALQSDGNGEIIATPKVLTADQQKAKIASGTQIPYREASSSGAATVAFVSAELSLDVTPHITPDGNIIMDLSITKNSVGAIFAGVPSIDTNSIDTSILVGDGQTAVLGGVFESSSVQSVDKTPFFGDLPVIGRLFRRDIESENKNELLIFITPKIVKDTYQ